MFRHALRSAIVVGGIVAGSSAALAENRVALVIGELAYRMVTPLPNPANDAQAMSQLLRDAGFEVTTAADLSQKEMNEKVGDFAAKIAAKGPDTVALMFYAGHGLQIDGENYLAPVDPRPQARDRHSAAGGALERHPEHVEFGAEQDAHPAARRLPQQPIPRDQQDRRPWACAGRYQDRDSRHVPVLFHVARRGGRGRQRRRQPVHDGATRRRP